MNERSHAGKWALWATVALVGYLLSCGPVSAMVHHCYHPNFDKTDPWQVEAYVVFYTPLKVICDYAPWFDETLENYGHWWLRVLGFPESDW